MDGAAEGRQRTEEGETSEQVPLHFKVVPTRGFRYLGGQEPCRLIQVEVSVVQAKVR